MSSSAFTNDGDDSQNNSEFEDSSETQPQEDVSLLCLSPLPIYFEPISSLTNVFFDKDNHQIFCVRSNGVGGVIVKAAKAEFNLSFRIEDKGNVTSVKFAPNLATLAIRRQDKCIDFLNFKNGQPVFPEYTQTFKAKSSKFQDFYWLDTNEILFVSELGIEHYQVFAEKRALKLLKFISLSLNWLIWSREAQVFVASTSSYGSVLNPFLFGKGQLVKLPKFEVDLPLPASLSKYSSSSTSAIASTTKPYFLNESDVVIGKIYSEFYVMVIRQISQNNETSSNGYSEIVMYQLLASSPAKKTNILKIQLSGRFTLNIVDELIIVHHRTTLCSLIFDIKILGEFDGYVISNYPVIKKASIQSAHIQPLNSDASSSSRRSSMIEVYAMSWITFLPNVVIDAKLGCFWYMDLNFKNSDLRIFKELLHDDQNSSNSLFLFDFLLNRKNTKKLILQLCAKTIEKRSSLKVIEEMFAKINAYYKYSLNTAPTKNTSSSLTENQYLEQTNSKVASSFGEHMDELPVLEQYDMHNFILYPLLEDDKWWAANAAFTTAIIVEYFRSLNVLFIPIEHYLYKLLVNALIKSNKMYQLHQYLQYHVLSDSKPLACLLLGLESTYPASNQLALDMLHRLLIANEEIVDILLSKGLVLSALRFGIQMNLGDNLNAAKFLETSKDLNDPLIYHEIFKFFEDRNQRLRGVPAFQSDENCEIYVRHFQNMFQIIK